MVVTDDQGRFVIPELPRPTTGLGARVWPAGFGQGAGQAWRPLELKAVTAPTEKAAAQYYPGVYWYSMIEMPGKDQFPGTGDKGNGIAPTMKTQNAWVDTVKNMCQSCHALGTRGIREVPEMFRSKAVLHCLGVRTQAGQAMPYMALALGSLGPEKAFTMFSQWTDRIAAGRIALCQAGAAARHRAQRGLHDVGLGLPEALPARRDFDRQAQPHGQFEWPDLRLARREHRPGSDPRPDRNVASDVRLP